MNDVSNVRPEVQKELTEDQTVMVDKAKRIQAILDEEPKSSLMRFLRYTESGVFPDVRLVQLKEKEDELEPADEGASGEDSGASAEPTPSTEPTQA